MRQTPFIDLKKQYLALQPQMEKALLKVASSAQFVGGPEVAELEKALASYVGAGEVIACANGTDALTLPLLAWGVGPGDAVFCPSFTFIATAEVVVLRGATPVFVDIDPTTYNLSPVDLERQIELVLKEGRLKPKVIIPVDLFGLPADFAAINRVAQKYDLLVLEDAAQGFGGERRGQKAGTFSVVAATSFFPAKPLGCYGDGGAVLVRDPELAEVIRSIRGHGQGQNKYEHVRLGMNSRLDTLQAAILLEKLAVFAEELKARQKVARGYQRLLSDEALKPTVPEGYYSAWAQYTIRVPAELRAGLIQYLKDAGVPANIYYPLGLHQQPFFKGLAGSIPAGVFPETEKAAREVLSLPMHPYLDEETLIMISSLVNQGLELGAKNV
ncbi:MAG: DegT/DnrJ/EryC1/StrS family aminotransferase [Deltaproteobacteria bacterium]|jgi:dTDP-4-amino-4,6-dideoxygalactose transaminase|nr:DegT/DnrJ/EryC1/StrS family aminotransferase [Deltaproteobacteria bacterium]